MDEALKRDPEHHLGWYVRVSLFYETGNEAAFHEAVHEALRIDPYEAHYYYLRANQLNKKGKFKEAKEQIEVALELEPENPQITRKHCSGTMSYPEKSSGELSVMARKNRLC
ncbi:tetratricopeptide repeat protein [Paenibacillus catalpae]|uniref:tetratricopeptide repeat protein n=1 Tax=Paenibacillus catalpae TaxID=1045775 RepID=UPI001113A4E6|nr:hypothetical protein [Paenibacillus catalpae]